MQNRIEWIDAAKGMGIFLVVLGHALQPGGLAPTVIWSFHMPLFFFLSGLTAKPWTHESAPAIGRGFKSLVVPYLFFSLISIILWSALKAPVSASETWSSQLLQMTYGVAGREGGMRYNVPLWFFTCLFSVRLIFSLLTANIKSQLILIICSLASAMFAHIYIFPRFDSALWNLDIALVALVFFVAGYTEQRHRAVEKWRTQVVWWVISLTALFIFTVSVVANGRVDMNLREFGMPIWFYLGAFSGIFLLIAVANRCAHFAYLKTLGHASIIIFPVHMLLELLPYRIIPVMKWYAYKLSRSELIAALLISIVEIAICVPVYFAIVRWVPFVIGQSKKSNAKMASGISGEPTIAKVACRKRVQASGSDAL